LVEFRRYEEPLPDSVRTLERYFTEGGVSLVRAVFENTFFADPDVVRVNPTWFLDYARRSREHYPGLERGEPAVWQGRAVRLSDNARAQMAWERYTRPLLRGSGYSICHIWGHPWDPVAFTAGWNLAYMAQLGPDAHRGSAPTRGHQDRDAPGQLGPLLSKEPRVRTPGVRI
jgi:hypothetical protein